VQKVTPETPRTPQEQHALGERYAYGRGVPRNDPEAIKWFRLAAEQGHAEAQYKLGVMFDKGLGTSENPREALHWYTQAAAQGHGGAENNLGHLYHKGRGVPQDTAEAARWYQQAAAHGVTVGQQNLDQLLRAEGEASQQPRVGTTPSSAAAPASPGNRAEQKLQTSFTAGGLTNSALISKIFAGDFVNIDLDRTDNRFGIFFQQYLEAYARDCSDALPPNKVEMTRKQCATEEVATNRWGIEMRRTCIAYKTVGTKLFAKPALYDAYNTVMQQRQADVGRELSRAFGDVARPDALSNMGSLLGDAQALASDTRSLVQMNACTSPGLTRFEDNLRLFALNRQPIPLGGTAPVSSVIMPPPGQAFRDQNYRKLIEDLILDDTKRWGTLAQFIQGSVTTVAVLQRDPKGRPVRVRAPYIWEGLMGRTSGQVTLTFSDGLPECLTYSETPAVCHSPNRRIVASYLEGGYSQ
jgi:hypothetical protein